MSSLCLQQLHFSDPIAPEHHPAAAVTVGKREQCSPSTTGQLILHDSARKIFPDEVTQYTDQRMSQFQFSYQPGAASQFMVQVR